MIFKLVELEELSGNRTQMLSVIFHNGDCWDDYTLYDKFLLEHEKKYAKEIEDIDIRLEIIGKKTGLRHDHFTDWEGRPGDGLIALFDMPKKKLRLYGMRFGATAIVLGGGGPKPKFLRALQESPKLTNENDLMRKVAATLTKAIHDKRIKVTENGLETNDGFVFDSED